MILLVYGTRPEYIKIKPLILEMEQRGIKYKTLFTGQHVDIAPKNADFILTMKSGQNRLDSIIESCMNLPDKWFEGIEYILVQGDTTSVVALALAAFNRKIKVIHLEAGLRTYDKNNPYPEETNRRIVSSIADIHFCPTRLSYDNLIAEKVEGKKYIVGNTSLDNLIQYKSECEYGNTILVTLHRRENHDNMAKWFTEINEIAKTFKNLDFVIPLHPNPNVQKHRHLLTHVRIINSLSHEDLIKLLVKSRMVITDSGGIQEECSFFNKKCLVCRKVTERPESVGLTSFMVPEPSDLSIVFLSHINNYKVNINSPFGDGTSSIKICNILQNELV